MEGLQRPLEEITRATVQVPPTGVNSIGFFGLAGLTMPWAGRFRMLEAEFPPVPREMSLAPREFTVWEVEMPSLPGDLGRSGVEARPVPAGYRARELDWRRTHADVLRAFANEWVALEGEEVVAHGPDPVQVVNEARARGIATPYIFFVEPSVEGVVRIGL